MCDEASLGALARVALSRDHDPVPWDDAPEWRRVAMAAVARAALGACGLSRADHAFSAWLLSMTTSGWGWGRSFDEKERTHPGILAFAGGLPAGEAKHWTVLVDAVRAEAKVLGVRITE
jgi:hypothetical protein